MNPTRKLSRRSFLSTVAGSAVAGGSLLVVHGDAAALQVTDRDPSDPIGRGRGSANRTGLTDSDPGDPVGNGRGGNRSSGGHTGVTDRDPTDPIGRGRGSGTRTGITDRDPTDPAGNGRGGNRGPTSGCSDSDPTDPGGNGRNCGAGRGTTPTGAYQTGRRERRYEVCWVDHPSRRDDECNLLSYSEWQITWSDGRVEYDLSESQASRASMQARGYTARWHRMLVNDWVGQ